MKADIRFAESLEDKRAAYRLRYDIYVEEMGRYRDIADHENRWLIEPEDEHARILIGEVDGRVVATSRMNLGSDHPFGERHRSQYKLDPFLDEMGPERLGVGERFMILPELRGSDLMWQMVSRGFAFAGEQRVELCFGDCEPHLLGLYRKMGFRTYSKENVNTADAGFLVPLVMVMEDHSHLRRLGSPLAEVLPDRGEDSRIPECAERLIDETTVYTQETTSAPEYWTKVHATLRRIDPGQYSLFDDLDELQTQAVLARSSIIGCRRGDRVLKEGNTARNMFVILEGVFEMRRRDEATVYLSVGDVFGEMAFLTGQPREMDILSFTDVARVLCLSESSLRQLIDEDPRTGAALLLNLSRMLCVKILRTSQA